MACVHGCQVRAGKTWCYPIDQWKGHLHNRTQRWSRTPAPSLRSFFDCSLGGGSTSEFQNEVQNCVMIAWYRAVPVQLYVGYFNINKTKVGETRSPITCVHNSAPKMDINVHSKGWSNWLNKRNLRETRSPITCVHNSAPKMDIDVHSKGWVPWLLDRRSPVSHG